MSEIQLPDHRVLTPGLMDFYGYKSRATFLAKEKNGLIPKRRQFPDGKLGNMWSELDAWAKKAEGVEA